MAITLNEVYLQIDEQRQVLVSLLNLSENNPVSPARIADVAMKLSILNELLGSFLPRLKLLQLESEKSIHDQARKEKLNITAASSLARTSTIKERSEYEKADIKHTDLWKLISMAQSYIRAETEERKGI